MRRLLLAIELAQRMQPTDMLFYRSEQITDIQDSAGYII
jgi:hypothetical protein